jgi:Fe-S oxidoreductase
VTPGQFVYWFLPGWILLLAVMLAAAYLFLRRAGQLYRYMRLGRPEDRFGDSAERTKRFLTFVLGQQRLFREPRAGLMHAVIFWGFLIITLSTVELLGRGFSDRFHIPFASSHAWFLLSVEFFQIGVLLAVAYAFYRRLVSRPGRLLFSGEALAILGLIAGLMITSLLAGAFRLAHDSSISTAWLPVSGPLSHAIRATGISGEAATVPYALFWWAHVGILFGFLVFIPYSKHLHIATAPFNVYFASTEPRGRLELVDFEATEQLGVSKIQDLSWKSVLDTYTCTECGRCDSVCPAAGTGKELHPRSIILNLQHYVIDEAGPALSNRPLDITSAGPSRRDDMRTSVPDLLRRSIPWARDHVRHPLSGARNRSATVDASQLRPLLGSVISEQSLWECTTCRACMQECPVFIEHVPKIVDMRRALVMMESRFPPELNDPFRGLELAGNPWQYPNETRGSWAEGLGVEIFHDGIPDDVDYLFWVGCYGSFDSRNRKVSSAVARLLQRAGVRFGILGPRERCTGDPARRAGNEFLYQMLAQDNIATLNAAEARKIVTACPHCFNSLKNEYPQLGGNYEVQHHSEVVAGLVADGRLRLDRPVSKTVTYHDPCYLGRYNGVYDPPRAILERIDGIELIEMARSRDRSFCCGAGGARGFMEEPPGKRVNEARVVQAEETGATTLAVSCPFCMNMFQDGIQGRGAGDRLVGEDIAELAELASRGMAVSREL